ncbi:MAG: hypothetical protein WC242_01365 [Candidatus Paceibacterota bacterium]|jgi:hypothetical protein
MSLLDEYRNCSTNPPTDVAKRILFDVIDDITSRSGWDWDDDPVVDDETKEEILETNLEKIQRHLQ